MQKLLCGIFQKDLMMAQPTKETNRGASTRRSFKCWGSVTIFESQCIVPVVQDTGGFRAYFNIA